GQRADTGGLEPDLLDRARYRALLALVGDGVADAERLVEDDRERGEQVGEDALRGKPDGDAADAEPGDQRGDVDAEVVQHDDAGDREDPDRDQQPDDAERAG